MIKTGKYSDILLIVRKSHFKIRRITYKLFKIGEYVYIAYHTSNLKIWSKRELLCCLGTGLKNISVILLPQVEREEIFLKSYI